MTLHRLAQPLTEPFEQHVAVGVTKRVVVELETVEIEQREHPALLGLQHPTEILQQLPAVRQTGEHVVAGLIAESRGQR